MRPIKSISIPTPCHEEWQQMTPVDSGRHCQSCCKTVIDFTELSNAEVISYLASHKNTCGRIDNSKLAAINYQLELEGKKQFSWKGVFAAAALSTLFPSMNAGAQIKPATEQAPYNSFSPERTIAAHVPGNITVKGKVTALADDMPIEGASVMVKGTTTGTQTSPDGSFKLKALKAGDTLMVSYIGYKTTEILISQQVDIRLEEATMALNDVCVGGYSSSRRESLLGGAITTLRRVPFYLRWWYWLLHQLKHVAHAITHL